MLLYFFVSSIVKQTGEKYLYSIALLIIFIGGALALLKENQYPAKIFIGDTFCYYAGIVLAIAAIFGIFQFIQDKCPLSVTGSLYHNSLTSSTPSLNFSSSIPVPGIDWLNIRLQQEN